MQGRQIERAMDVITKILFSYNDVYPGAPQLHLTANWALVFLVLGGVAACSPVDLIWAPAMLFVQFAMCCILKCQGVSGVWCGLAGLLAQGLASGRYSGSGNACTGVAGSGVAVSAMAVAFYALIDPDPKAIAMHLVAAIAGVIAGLVMPSPA